MSSNLLETKDSNAKANEENIKIDNKDTIDEKNKINEKNEETNSEEEDTKQGFVTVETRKMKSQKYKNKRITYKPLSITDFKKYEFDVEQELIMSNENVIFGNKLQDKNRIDDASLFHYRLKYMIEKKYICTYTDFKRTILQQRIIKAERETEVNKEYGKLIQKINKQEGEQIDNMRKNS